MREQAIYARRFASREQYRASVWAALVYHTFQPYVPADASVLDLGCGYGEFINTVHAARRYAIDANPDARAHLATGVEFIEQDCTRPWPIPEASLDVIFSSNFFEHLTSKEALMLTLEQAWRALRGDGTLIVMGPNIRYVPGEYWDHIDHNIALTDRSMVEAMELAGFKRQRVVDRFVPYTMSEGGRRVPLWLVGLYLRLPFAWRFLGKQFFIVMKKKDSC